MKQRLSSGIQSKKKKIENPNIPNGKDQGGRAVAENTPVKKANANTLQLDVT